MMPQITTHHSALNGTSLPQSNISTKLRQEERTMAPTAVYETVSIDTRGSTFAPSSTVTVGQESIVAPPAATLSTVSVPDRSLVNNVDIPTLPTDVVNAVPTTYTSPLWALGLRGKYPL